MKLLDYIRGFRRGKEVHRLQKEAMHDPFLADAMDGYDSVKGDQGQQIKSLRRHIAAKAKRKQNHAVAWSVAASLLIGVCLSGYFLFQKDKLPQETFIALETIPEDTASEATPQIKDETRLVKVIPKDSVRPLISREHKIQEVISPPIQTALEDTGHTRQLANNIKGRVTDSDGEPLPGVNVVIKGTDQRTVTDLDGSFTLKTDGEKELVVNSIGYESVILPADISKEMLIAMNEDNRTLDEAVVVGYASRKMASATGSVASVEQSVLPQPAIGRRAYKKYLKKNLVRPVDGECTGVKGKVSLTFHVDKQGRPIQIKVEKSLCSSVDREAVRLVKEGPDWTLGGEEVHLDVEF